MSDRQKCPKCGAEPLRNQPIQVSYGTLWTWKCFTHKVEHPKLEGGESITESLTCLRNQLASANKIIAKLPVFADGVPFTIGDMAYHPSGDSGIVRWGQMPRTGGCEGYIVEDQEGDTFIAKPCECCSAREAAAQATGPKGEAKR